MRRSLLTTLLALGLVLATPAAPTAPAAATTPAARADEGVHPEWGHTSAPNASLHQGCRRYGYSYTLTPPDGDWALETFLVGPGGRQHGSGYFLTGTDPLAGTGAWRLCRRATRGGTYTIRALLTVQNGGDHYEGWLPDTTFRLRKRHR